MPFILAVLFTALAAVSPGKKPAAEASSVADVDATTKAVRTIEVDPKKKVIQKIKLVPNISTVIQFPEMWTGNPTCGNCVFGDARYEGQLFRIDVSPETRTINIKMARLPGPDAPPDGFVTNLDVTLEGGASVSFFCLVVPEPNDADGRIEVVLPADATGAARMSAKERELARAFDERVKKAARDSVMKGLGFGTKCHDYVGSPRRSDNLVVRMKQICRNGALLWVAFEVENRQRNDVALAVPSLSGQNGAVSTLSHYERSTLLFNQRSIGIAAIELADPTIPSSSYVLVVKEDGGKSRTVQIDDLEL